MAVGKRTTRRKKMGNGRRTKAKGTSRIIKAKGTTKRAVSRRRTGIRNVKSLDYTAQFNQLQTSVNSLHQAVLALPEQIKLGGRT